MTKPLGSIIRHRRRQLGKTVWEVGAISGPYVSRIETEKAPPPTNATLCKLEAALEFPAGHLTRRAALLRTPPDVLALIDPAKVAQYLEGTAPEPPSR